MADIQAIMFAGAMGAAGGILLAGFLHISWLELPLLLGGACAGAGLAFGGSDVISMDVF